MTRFLLAAALAALLIPAARAQPAGFDVAGLDAFFSRPPKVEVNLRGALLRLAASATDDDPDTAGMLRGLRSILVRVYPLDAVRAGFTDRLADIERQMLADGWQTLVRVRPDGDETDDVWVYVRGSDDPDEPLDGLVVVSLDHDDGDASFVIIDGQIDPSRIGALGGRFGVDIGQDSADDAQDAADAAQEAADAAQEAADEAADAAQEAADEADNAAREAQDGAVEAEREAREQARDDAREARRLATPARPATPARSAAPARPSAPVRPN